MRQYGFKVHRQTIPADIIALRSFGMEIQEVMSSQKRYNLISREYDIAEIKPWVFGFGGKVVINGPAEVKEEYKEMVLKAAERL